MDRRYSDSCMLPGVHTASASLPPREDTSRMLRAALPCRDGRVSGAVRHAGVMGDEGVGAEDDVGGEGLVRLEPDDVVTQVDVALDGGADEEVGDRHPGRGQLDRAPVAEQAVP